MTALLEPLPDPIVGPLLVTKPVPCAGRHTKYQPTLEEWRCPKCGQDSVVFFVDTMPESAADGCPKLHTKDHAHCVNCGKSWLGQALARIFKAKARHVECPTCKGKGVVQSG